MESFANFSRSILKSRSLFGALPHREPIPDGLTALLALNHPDYEDRTRAQTAGAQQTQYFVEIRDNTIEGSFGSEITGPSAGQPHPQNRAGSGINLATQIFELDANKMPTYQLTPHLSGFGVSVSHNVITHAALMQWGAYDTWAIGIGAGGAFDGESPTPGYVDTLVYGNTASNLQAPLALPVVLHRSWHGTRERHTAFGLDAHGAELPARHGALRESERPTRR
jgi:hypothetical protein